MRADSRMDNYMVSAIEAANTINRSYRELKRYVQHEIESILKHIGDEDSLAYEFRMKRLNALLVKTESKLKAQYGLNEAETTDFLRSIIPEAYYHTIFDVAQASGEMPVFAPVNERLINTIIRDKWSGDHYSKRIWKNNKLLEKELRQVLTTAAMTGESIYKTSRRLNAAFNTAAYNTQRIVRTETTYACNQAELQSYAALEIERYEYYATLDTRTSPQCRQLDGQVFPTSEAQAGKNLPPMHPNCRSTTVPYFENGRPKFRTARDKDGKRIQVPADMKYDEWYKKYIDPNYKPPKVEPVQPQKPQFTPATNIQEAQTYAEKYCEERFMDKTFKGVVDFSGISLENANQINKALTETFETLNLEKLAGIKAVSPSSKLGKKAFKSGADAVASYDPIQNGIFLNKDILKNEKTFAEYVKKSNESFETVMNNIDKLSGDSKETALLYKKAGRQLVGGQSVDDMITHELGHHVQWTALDAKTTNDITSRKKQFAPNISGYANATNGEYLAESYAAYMKGEFDILDPEYVKFINSKKIIERK